MIIAERITSSGARVQICDDCAARTAAEKERVKREQAEALERARRSIWRAMKAEGLTDEEIEARVNESVARGLGGPAQ